MLQGGSSFWWGMWRKKEKTNPVQSFAPLSAKGLAKYFILNLCYSVSPHDKYNRDLPRPEGWRLWGAESDKQITCWVCITLTGGSSANTACGETKSHFEFNRYPGSTEGNGLPADHSCLTWCAERQPSDHCLVSITLNWMDTPLTGDNLLYSHNESVRTGNVPLEEMKGSRGWYWNSRYALDEITCWGIEQSCAHLVRPWK